MKRSIIIPNSILFFLLIMTASKIVAQNSIVYDYDESGNRTSRVLSVQRSAAVTFPINAKAFNDLNESAIKAKEELTNLESIIKIYPNPTSGYIKISLENYADPIKGRYQLYNLGGKVLKHSAIDSPLTEIDLGKVQNGMYVLRLTLNGSVIDYKVIKQN